MNELWLQEYERVSIVFSGICLPHWQWHGAFLCVLYIWSFSVRNKLQNGPKSTWRGLVTIANLRWRSKRIFSTKTHIIYYLLGPEDLRILFFSKILQSLHCEEEDGLLFFPWPLFLSINVLNIDAFLSFILRFSFWNLNLKESFYLPELKRKDKGEEAKPKANKAIALSRHI